jgi:hypothetical protein
MSDPASYDVVTITGTASAGVEVYVFEVVGSTYTLLGTTFSNPGGMVPGSAGAFSFTTELIDGSYNPDLSPANSSNFE